MRVKRLEDILHECIDAGVEGRRTVEQSLALYPAVAGELEPLLRTALNLSNQFQAYSPPPAVQQRGLDRFLTAARDRRNVRQFARSFERRSWFSRLTQKPLYGGIAAAAAVLIITVSIASLSALSSSNDGSGGESVVDFSNDPSAATVVVIQQRIDDVRQKANTVGVGEGDPDLQDLRKLLDQLRAEVETSGITPVGAAATVTAVDRLIDEIVTDNPDLADDAVVQATGTANRDLAGALFPTQTPGTVATEPAASPTPVVTDGPTQPPTDTPVPTDTPTAEPTPTASPTPDPTPTTTADSRPPAIFGN